tara:strand:+ start:120 stop:578 length:459 start_codon:yes stop_codon:yes gene_type:complete
VNSIRKNSVEQHEILVYVNEGVDGSADWCKQENIKFIHSEENVGVCTALNALFEIATNDIICYVNDDMYLCPNWDEPLIKEIENIGHEKFYLSSTMIEPENTGNKCVLAPFHFGKHLPNLKKQSCLRLCQPYKKWIGAAQRGLQISCTEACG